MNKLRNYGVEYIKSFSINFIYKKNRTYGTNEKLIVFDTVVKDILFKLNIPVTKKDTCRLVLKN